MRFNGHIVADFVMRNAVKSLMSLGRIEGYPPFRHDKVCSTVKGDPQAHAEGILCNDKPYRNARASLKAPLCREKPNSSTGSTINQLEAPLSRERSMALWRSRGSEDFTWPAMVVNLERFLFLISVTADS